MTLRCKIFGCDWTLDYDEHNTRIYCTRCGEPEEEPTREKSESWHTLPDEIKEI